MKKHTHPLLLPSLLLVCITLLSGPFLQGCGTKAARPCIAVLFRADYNNFFKMMETGVRETAEKEGVNVVTLENNQLEGKEADLIFQRLLNTHMNALIICAEDEDKAKKNCMPLIVKANEHAIPVLFIHAGIEEQYLKERNVRAECLISADNLKGGALAGEYIAKRTGRAGRVLMLEGSLQSYGGRKRRQGFLDAVRKYPSLQCLEVFDLDWTREMALATSRKMFRQHPDIKAVFAFCDMMAIGAADAARLSPMPGLTIVGFDGSEQGRAALKEGRIAATFNQSPYEIGRMGILCALKALKGEKLPYYIYTKTELITEESLRLPFQK